MTLGLFKWLPLLGVWLLAQTLNPPPDYEVSLFTGIPKLAKLGDSYQILTQTIPHPYEALPLPEAPEFQVLKISQAVLYPALGLRIYFRREGAVLITIQEPFKGKIRSKKIDLFPFARSPAGTWEAYLIKQLGIPDFTVSGGRLNSKGLFYSWGDISFNAMGPNQLALYREPSIAKYREKNFGREITLSPESINQK